MGSEMCITHSPLFMLLGGADSQPAGALLAACGGWEGVAWRICKALVCHLFVSIHSPHSAAAFLSQCVGFAR